MYIVFSRLGHLVVLFSLFEELFENNFNFNLTVYIVIVNI